MSYFLNFKPYLFVYALIYFSTFLNIQHLYFLNVQNLQTDPYTEGGGYNYDFRNLRALKL